MIWFTYVQNNSGGRFVGPKLVIVEAESPAIADARAKEHCGVYFDGCEEGSDCSCCGDRWMRAHGNGDPVPSLYGDPLTAEIFAPGLSGNSPVLIRFASGELIELTAPGDLEGLRAKLGGAA